MPKREIPREALSRFENLQGIPLGVIAELFGRMNLPTDLQTAFWTAVAAKEVHYITGKVRVKTNRDGTKQVTVFDKSGPVTFQVPDDLTDEQLAELKRAQGARLWVIVEYQVDGKKKPVNSVEVGEEKPGGQEEGDKKFL